MHTDKPTTHKLTTQKHTKDTDKKEDKTKKEDKKSKPTETKKPNLDIKSDTHMLPGIDNIHDYIARKKSPPPHKITKKEWLDSLISPDGTDLRKLHGLYALAPHAQGDHKLVYMQDNKPKGLVDDPRKRTKWSMYVKNGRDIYMVTLTMKEHPTLKDIHNEPYDVWIIENAQQLNDQIEAIKAGMWWGENFWEIILFEAKESKADKPVSEAFSEKEETSKQPDTSTVVVLPEAQEELPEEKDTPAPTEEKSHEVEILLPTKENIDSDTWDISLDGIDSIDINLPADEIFPETDIDITLPEDKESVAPEIGAEIVSLDGIEPTEDVIEDEKSNETPLEEEVVVPQVSLPNKEDAELQVSAAAETPINLDIWSPDEESTPSRMHFQDPTQTQEKVSSKLPYEIGEETPSGSLFWSVDISTPTFSSATNEAVSDNEASITDEGGMFRQPPETSSSSVSDEDQTEATSWTTVSWEEMPSLDSLPPMTWSSSEESQDTYITEPTVTENTSIPEENPEEGSLNLDNLTIDDESKETDKWTIDLDSISPEPTDLEKINTQDTEVVSSPTTTTKNTSKKSSFPFHIVIRIVLFIVIVWALILVWKVMFPKINWTKPVDDTQITTWDTIDVPTPDDTGDTILPDDSTPPWDAWTPIDDGTQETPPTPDDNVVLPSQGLTLPELTEKLKQQQTEARKVLNIAKLLENKQAIKFSLAAMLKAGNVLERIGTESTITAEDVLRESQKIESYLMEANKLVE